MFYEIRPLLISLAKFSCALLWAPKKAKAPLRCSSAAWLYHPVWLQPLWVSRAHSKKGGTLQPLLKSTQEPWFPFIHLGVRENPGLSVSLAKSSRLGPNSLSNILSLMNKATPHPNALPISRVNWEWNRLVLWKKRKKNIAQASLACLKPWNQTPALEIKMLPSFRLLNKVQIILGRHLWWLQISRLKISPFIYLLYQE